MRLGTRLSGAQLTLLSRLSATGEAPNRQCFLLCDFHYIMVGCPAASWSILTASIAQIFLTPSLEIHIAHCYSTYPSENEGRFPIGMPFAQRTQEQLMVNIHTSPAGVAVECRGIRQAL